MIRTLIACTALIAFSAGMMSVQVDAAEPSAGEWKTIFNGKDLTGWNGDSRLWSVRDGVIHGETTPDKTANGNTFLIWEEEPVSDFELSLAFRCSATNNSGIQYRSRHIDADNARNDWVVRGYQHEIRNENELPSVAGFIYDEGGKRGRMCLVGEKAVWTADGKELVETFLTADEYKKLFNLDDWNEVRIVAKGNRLQHYLNGTLILDCTDKHPEFARTDGVLALQLHAGKPMWVEFKDLKIRPAK
ncbi:hypothetical protein KOR42_36580 [Thalassoglobus neptunius]|uniref:3-keto-alpha-glucoside-1,2-lyase/3-keto-2-hydroxy-glucal hydratase domain-containing protein n=1 Tax=Thalassoglobus neptunius TaxID=1938619 RepID=A0A5C5WJB2_9PLAN|nr:DUF1080 domain-containing protein [Thalassoglobus neptunius]TWT50111.1 hypothetical protein KOR42_36580 [Thalassoglobus neptunius]